MLMPSNKRRLMGHVACGMGHGAWGTPSIFDKSPLVEHSHKSTLIDDLLSLISGASHSGVE